MLQMSTATIVARSKNVLSIRGHLLSQLVHSAIFARIAKTVAVARTKKAIHLDRWEQNQDQYVSTKKKEVFSVDSIIKPHQISFIAVWVGFFCFLVKILKKISIYMKSAIDFCIIYDIIINE